MILTHKYYERGPVIGSTEYMVSHGQRVSYWSYHKLVRDYPRSSLHLGRYWMETTVNLFLTMHRYGKGEETK